MDRKLTIGKVARESGLSVPNVRFYEAQGIIPPPQRTDAGYRLYSPNDVRRLRLARRARLLGLSLLEVKDLVDRAFSSGCGAYAQEILNLVAAQRTRIDQQIAELQALRGELDTLEQEARLVASDAPGGLTVAECHRCLLVDGESGEHGYCTCGSSSQVIPIDSLVGDRMSEPHTPEIIETLMCEIGKRPGGAPTFDDIVGSVTALLRDADGLTVTFNPAAAETVRAVVAAEQQCCSTIGWRLAAERGLRLHITATTLQLDALEQIFGGRRVV
jgi:DNA-binding transcriptional MerR regulator